MFMKRFWDDRRQQCQGGGVFWKGVTREREHGSGVEGLAGVSGNGERGRSRSAASDQLFDCRYV